MALPSSTYDTATLVNPTSSLTDFTLIVDLSRMSAAWWAAVDTSDGTKGRAAKDSGPTELACDWIDFDDANETGLLRVKWSGTLASSGTQTLRVYPPMAANASVAASDTYGSDNAYDADWLGYWPLHDANDRTANGNHLTANGGVTAGGATGKIGRATDFDGSDDYFSRTNLTVALGQSFSLWHEQWQAGSPFHNSVTANVTCVGLRTPAIGRWDCTWEISNVGYPRYKTGGPTGDAHVFATASTGGVTTLHINGNIESTAASGFGQSGTSGEMNIGSTSNGKWLGWINEVQYHDVERTSEWAAYEYDQTNDQATFWGTWTNTPVAGGISIPVVMHHRRMMGVS